MSAMALPALGKMVGQSEKARLVVSTRTFPFIPSTHDLEEEVGGAGIVGEVPELVQDQETALAVVIEAAREAPRGLLASEVEEKLGGGGEQHVVPGEDRLVGDVLGDHRLAEALGRDEDEVTAGGEELEVQGGLDGGAVDARGPGPVEGVHRGEAADPTAQETAFEAAAGAFLLFDLDEVFEELGRAPATLGRQRDQVVQVRGGVVEPEEREGVRKWGHRAPPGGPAG
jgi:hypothetical protein